MASAAKNDNLDAIIVTWREFQTRTPVKLRKVKNERHYQTMVSLMNRLLDEIGDRALASSFAFNSGMRVGKELALGRRSFHTRNARSLS
jgi:hypothetical protein